MNRSFVFAIAAVLLTTSVAQAQVQCGIARLTVAAAGTGELNGLQITIAYPGGISVLCPDPSDTTCQVRPAGPFAPPMLFNVNAATAGQVVTAVSQSLGTSAPAPVAAVLTVDMIYFGNLPDIADFGMPVGYFTDVEGAEITSAQPVLASVVHTGSINCPTTFPGAG